MARALASVLVLRTCLFIIASTTTTSSANTISWENTLATWRAALAGNNNDDDQQLVARSQTALAASCADNDPSALEHSSHWRDSAATSTNPRDSHLARIFAAASAPPTPEGLVSAARAGLDSAWRNVLTGKPSAAATSSTARAGAGAAAAAACQATTPLGATLLHVLAAASPWRMRGCAWLLHDGTNLFAAAVTRRTALIAGRGLVLPAPLPAEEAQWCRRHRVDTAVDRFVAERIAAALTAIAPSLSASQRSLATAVEVDALGQTPLHVAAGEGSGGLAAALVLLAEGGAPWASVRSRRGQTPVHLALYADAVELAVVLLCAVTPGEERQRVLREPDALQYSALDLLRNRPAERALFVALGVSQASDTACRQLAPKPDMAAQHGGGRASALSPPPLRTRPRPGSAPTPGVPLDTRHSSPTGSRSGAAGSEHNAGTVGTSRQSGASTPARAPGLPVSHSLVSESPDEWRVSAENAPWFEGLASPTRCDIAVEAAAGLTRAHFVQHYLAPQRPVLVRGGVAAWPAVSKWTPAYLNAVLGSAALAVGVVPYAQQYGLHQQRMSLLRFLATAPNQWPPPYVFDNKILLETSQLRADYDVPLWFKGTAVNAPQFMLGGAGSGAPFHFHQNAWNGAVAGRKRWFLRAPADAVVSSAPVSGLDLSRLGATVQQCVQHPGDLLFIPGLWSHAVLNLDTAVAVAVEFYY